MVPLCTPRHHTPPHDIVRWKNRDKSSLTPYCSGRAEYLHWRGKKSGNGPGLGTGLAGLKLKPSYISYS